MGFIGLHLLLLSSLGLLLFLCSLQLQRGNRYLYELLAERAAVAAKVRGIS